MSTLTIKHTDIYLQRTYSRIINGLNPYSVIFLGDLFDGGREWATETSESPEHRFKKYGELYWLNEYRRFNKIFLPDWHIMEGNRRFIASLPGNHDLGFGNGIQKPVKDRFIAYFGEPNRIDIIGNHTFVGLDTVSLSAKEQDMAGATQEIWGPPNDFLNAYRLKRDEAYRRHLDMLKYKPSLETPILQDHEVMEAKAEHSIATPRPASSDADLPTILLSHVPLYRSSGTPCGPLREKHPPSPPAPGETESPAIDGPNSIPYYRGYQYQNALTAQLSHEIITKLGSNVDYVFSGDDHDYCEVVHRGFPSRGQGIKEITVKSISWAMGVRRPGFLLVSLWNELDSHGRSLKHEHTSTIQTHLCLLPDQLSIFIQYGLLLAISLFALAARAGFRVIRPAAYRTSNAAVVLLPRYSGAETEKHLTNGYQNHTLDDAYGHQSSTSSTSSAEDYNGAYLSTRNAAANRARSESPFKAGYGYRVVPVQPERDEYNRRSLHKPAPGPKGDLAEFLTQWGWSVTTVGCVVLPYYIWLWNYR